MKANKNNVNQDDLLVDQVDQKVPLAQQDPEHPKKKDRVKSYFPDDDHHHHHHTKCTALCSVRCVNV